MVLFKRKRVQYLSPPSLPDDAEIWVIEETGEVFGSYEDYQRRNDFYRQKRFICEITGHSGQTFRDALRMEKEASGEIDYSFPEPLRERILRKVQFQQVARIDYIVDWIYEVFKRDFYPGENVIITIDDERYTGRIKEKTKFPELVRSDGSIEREAFARYFCDVDNYTQRDALLDEEHVARDKKVFTKQRLRSYLKNSISREAWTGAPWLVKPRLAEEYRIPTDIPPQLTQEFQIKQRKATNTYGKKGEADGQFLSFQAYGPQGGPQYYPLKPRGKKPTAQEEQAHLQFAQFLQNHQPTANTPFYIPHGFHGMPHPPPIANGFHPIAAKGQPKPPALPPPKYPIEDLEIPPVHDGTHRPPLKYLSNLFRHNDQHSQGLDTGLKMESVGQLLETWNTLNVYCQVFELDSFTFDDYVDALALSSEPFLECELLVEIHCAVLKQLVNDVNDKNGQIQISLPDQADSEDERSTTSESHHPSPTPEAEVIKPPARSTRSSLLKSEAAELREATSSLSLADSKIHRAQEMDHHIRGYDWKMRLRKRDLGQGGWVTIIVGLLNQLAQDPRHATACNDILVHLAPLEKEPSPGTACEQYQALDINHRVSILQILCTKSLETKAIRQYMEECSLQMTEHRKERNELKKQWKVAVEELRQLHDERKELQPEDTTATPPSEVEEMDEPKEEPEPEVEDEGAASDTGADSDDAPHQGRSLRRATNRATARKKRAEGEKGRKAAAAAEKAKKPSKEERKYERLLAKIETVKEQIKTYENHIAVVENDLREADCPRTKVLGKDRFWNRYYWMERNAMPFAGLPNSSTASAGYANGCIWVQGPDDIERAGFIELSDAENAQYARAFQLTVPQRKELEEGETHVFDARQWGYYDDPEALDMLIGWLDNRGVREVKLRKELSSQRENISRHMVKRQEYLSKDNDYKWEANEPATRISTRTKTYVGSSNHRCLKWRNTTALEEHGHLHSQPKPPTRKQRGVAVKKDKVVSDEEEVASRQTRKPKHVSAPAKGTARTSGRTSRPGTRYSA